MLIPWQLTENMVIYVKLCTRINAAANLKCRQFPSGLPKNNGNEKQQL